MTPNEESGYLFNVDILIKGSSNGHALQLLLQLLNSKGEIADYSVKSGIHLGEIIEASLNAKRKSLIPPPVRKAEPKPTAAVSGNTKLAAGSPVSEWIQSYISSNRLVRVLIETPKGRQSIPCRILNYLPDNEVLNVYHVDEKQVYTYKLNEIIDILEV